MNSGHEVLLVTGQHALEAHTQPTVPMVTVPEMLNPWLRKVGFDYFNPFAVVELRKHLARFRPQIIHVHSLYGLSTALVQTATRFSPVYITLHDAFLAYADSGILTPKWGLANSYLKIPHGLIHRKLNRRLLRYATLVSPSKWLAEFFENSGFSTPLHIPNGIKPNGEQTKYENLVLWVGALTSFKGLPSIIGKIAPLLSQSGWRFVVVGDGPFRKKLSMQFPEVEFVGYEDPTPYYEHASILVCSSLGWENFPTVILEAMRHGICVIGHDLGGISELISHERNGLVYQKEAELMKHLDNVVSNNEKARRMGLCGRQHFLNNYQLEVCVNRYLELYRHQSDLPLPAKAKVSPF